MIRYLVKTWNSTYTVVEYEKGPLKGKFFVESTNNMDVAGIAMGLPFEDKPEIGRCITIILPNELPEHKKRAIVTSPVTHVELIQ